MDGAKNANPNALFNYMEIFSWLACTSIYFTFYNPIGELGRKWDLWNGSSPLQIIDDWQSWTADYIPYVPAMIFPYVAVYAMPVVYLVSLISSRGLDIGRVRRFFITQMALITVAFVFYLTMPCRTDILFNEETQTHEYGEDSWIGRLCYKHVHQGISLYVAFPSMHTAHSFSMAMAFAEDNLTGVSAAWILAICTLFSTLTTKAHFPPHLAAGLLLAFLAQRFVFNAITRNLRNFSRVVVSSWVGFYVAALAPVAFFAVGEKLHSVSGWKTDIPAMFGFERNPVAGLYGFAY